MKSEPSLLLPVYVTHIVMHSLCKPPLLLMPLWLNGKAMFFPQRQSQIIRTDGRKRGRESEKVA